MSEKSLIQAWAESIKNDIGTNYRRIEHFGIFAKDENWDQLLTDKVEQTTNGWKVTIFGPYYSYWLQNGRGPTVNKTPHSPTVREVVYRWIKKYNIQAYDPKYNQKSLSYFISKSIHEKGIKVPGKYNPGGLVSDVITKERIDTMLRDLSLYMIGDIRSDVIKTLK